MKDLVELSPAPTPDGSLVLGSQRSSVFVLDAARGVLLRTLRGSTEDDDDEVDLLADPAVLGGGGGDDDGDGDGGGSVQMPTTEGGGILAIGRKDYVIRSVHPAFGEQWNVSWSSLQHLSSLAVRRPPSSSSSSSSSGGGGKGSTTTDAKNEGKKDEEKKNDKKIDGDELRVLNLVVGPDNSLRRIDSGKGWIVWTRHFEAPPLAAYPADGPPMDLVNAFAPPTERKEENNGGGGGGGGGDVLSILSPPSGSSSSNALVTRTLPDNQKRPSSSYNNNNNNDDDDDETGSSCRRPDDALLVGVMGDGGLFGMKVPGSSSSGSSLEQCDAAGGGGSNGDGGNLLIKVDDGEDDVDSTRNGLIVAPEQQQQQQEVDGWWKGRVCAGEGDDDEDGTGGTCAVPLGLFPIQEQCTDSTLLYLPPPPPSEMDARRGRKGEKKDSMLRRGLLRMVAMIMMKSGIEEDDGEVYYYAVVEFLESVVLPVGGVVVGAVVPVVVVRRRRNNSTKSSRNATSTSTSSGKKTSTKKNRKKTASSSSSAPSPLPIAPLSSTVSTIENKHENEYHQPPPQQQQQQQQQRSFITIDGVTLVGRLRVGPGILGYGSGGTVVYEGELDGRQVAVKRLLRQFVDLAKKEIGALIVSDEHPNVVRCFAMEEDAEFVYLALERCAGTLADAMAGPAGKERFLSSQGMPTEFALRVIEDVGRGLAALHARGIVHRDLKPHNVLLSDGGRAKLSDMGLSKQLVPEQASFETLGHAGGSPGWQAPEQLALRAGNGSGGGGGVVVAARQTAAVDVFSFGLLIHYCLTGGGHPFGEGVDRDAAILHGRRSLDAVGNLPEAEDLLTGMLAAVPEDRPTVAAVMAHPLWWPVPRGLAFLIDISDRVEGEDRAGEGGIYLALEALSPEAIRHKNSHSSSDQGDHIINGNWAAALDSGLLNNLGKYRRYDFSSLRDLLRVVRNKHSHFRELPEELQARIGAIPDGFLNYFSSRFPRLLTTCFYFALRWCREDAVFTTYFPAGSEGLLTTTAPVVMRDPEAAAAAVTAAKLRLAAAAAEARQQQQRSVTAENLGTINTLHMMNMMNSGGGGGGGDSGIGLPAETLAPPVAVLWDAPSGTSVLVFPRRHGSPPCDFYVKTGHCRYGESCRFDHPPGYAVRLSGEGLPLRPGEVMCRYYERNGECKFGPACRFNHPHTSDGGGGSSAAAGGGGGVVSPPSFSSLFSGSGGGGMSSPSPPTPSALIQQQQQQQRPSSASPMVMPPQENGQQGGSSAARWR